MVDTNTSWHRPDPRRDQPLFVFRRDLKVVFENKDSGAAPEIRVVDPTNSKQFSFTEQEYFLCLAADGQTGLDRIAADYRQRFGKDISLKDLTAFYRRLRIVGLVERDGAAARPVEVPQPAPAPEGPPASGPAQEAGPGPADDVDDPFGGFGGLGGGFGGGAGFGGGGFGGGAGFGGGGGGAGGFGGGQGGPGRERLLAMLAAKRAGGDPMAALAGGFAQTQPQAKRAGPASVHLFNPSGLLRTLYILFFPLKLALWLLVPAVFVAVLTILHRWGDFVTDFHAMTASLQMVTKLLIAVATVNLTSRLAQGAAILSSGGKVSSLGIRLIFGVLPRFYIDTTGIRALDRNGQLWAYGAPMLTRLGIFAGGIIAWAMTRDSGTWLPEICLLLGQIGFVSFLIMSFPLFPADGMRWISTYFGDPQLGPKALLVLKARLGGKPLPPTVQRSDVGPLLVFSFGIVLTVSVFLLGIFAFVALSLEQQFGGLGATMALALLAAFFFWLAALKVAGPREGAFAGAMAGAMAGDGRIAGLAAAAAAPAAAGPASAAQAEPEDTLLDKARVIWITIGAVLVALAFLPYDYEAGGTVELLPSERSSAVARSSGEIVAVHVSEGEQVSAGALLAEFSSWEQESAIAVTEAQLEKEQAELARLRAGAKPEEVALARRRVESAEAQIRFSAGELERQEQLLERGATTYRDWERASSTHEANLAALEVARAELDLIESGATAEELAKAEAEVKRLTLQLAFQEDELNRTRIHAPISGQVVTPNLQLLHGSFFERGQTFLEIENDDQVVATIAVPEGDVGLLEPGDTVRLKIYSLSDATILGEVKSIAPTADAEDFGRVVRVEAVFDNPHGQLRPAMTGYAKIEGEEMRVWEAFLRRIVRFFQIEVWSWVP